MTTTATATMKSFVFDGLNKVATVDRSIPRPGPNDVIVKTTTALICTSDVHTVRGALPIEHGRALGHEAVGVVHELGSAVDGFQVGQRVMSAATTPCFHCHPCQRGYTSQCQGPLGAYRFTVQRDGNLAEYYLVNEATGNLTALPDDIRDEQAVYATDMLTTGFAGAEHAELALGDTVAVFAQGAVGLCATIGCRLLGAGLIIAVESIPQRQELARHFGADVIVDYTKVDPVEKILELTDGEGTDAAIEAFGFPQTWEAALRVTKPGGRISNIGYHGEVTEPLQVPLDAFGMGMADKQIWGGLCPGGSERMGRLLRLIQTGKVDPTPMTTHEFEFDEVERAFRKMEAKEDGMIKPLIRFA